jgi:SpoIID/LytB domain protein
MRKLVTAVTAAVLVGFLVPTPGRAATRVRVRGGGWGHGIGMSQYGAFGRARNGASATQILEHYYTRAHVRRANVSRGIRVGLLQYRSSISSSSEVFAGGEGRIVFKVNGRRIAAGGDSTRWRVERSPTGGMRLYKNGNRIRRNGKRVFGSPSSPFVAVYEKFGSKLRISEKNNSYAYGRMLFGTYASPSCGGEFCLRLVLALPMQKYLYGLGEVPSSWPQASLRSQAIAGRTYAFEKIRRSGQHRYPCDCAVYDSTLDQAYIGDAKRTGSGVYWDDWKRAVNRTRKKVVLYRGAPIQALYSSSSGGHTENNENVWGGAPVPYLRGVSDRPDRVSANPNHTWSFSMRWRAFENKLQAAYGIGNLRRFALVRPFGVSGRVTVVKPDNSGGVRIRGSRRTVRVSGWSVRSALSLKDTLFRVEIVRSAGSNFVGTYRRLDGEPGAAQSDPYLVPRSSGNSLGQAQEFSRGRMTWRRKTDEAFWQRGPVLNKYDAVGRERSSLGMPTSDIWGPGSYLGGTYVNGMIVWSDDTEAHTVRGRWVVAYRRSGGPEGDLGLPLRERERVSTLPGGGKRQRFASGTLYLNPRLDSIFALWGGIDVRYRGMGEASSACGYPISGVEAIDSGQQATFQNGTITATSSGIAVACS